MYNFKQLKGMFSQNRRSPNSTKREIHHRCFTFTQNIWLLPRSFDPSNSVLRTSFTTLKDPIMYLGSRYASAMEFFMSKQLTAKTRILFLQKSSIIDVSQGLY